MGWRHWLLFYFFGEGEPCLPQSPRSGRLCEDGKKRGQIFSGIEQAEQEILECSEKDSAIRNIRYYGSGKKLRGNLNGIAINKIALYNKV